MVAACKRATIVVLALAFVLQRGAGQLQRGTYTLSIRASASSCLAGGGYLTAPTCDADAPVTAQPSLLSGAAGQQQVWQLEATGGAGWTNIQGTSIWIQSDARAAAQPPCGSRLHVPSCARAGFARMSAQTGTRWVLEPGPADGLFYIRAACAFTNPLYLGFHKSNCQGSVPALYPRTGPSASFVDLVWALEPVSQSAGAARIDSVTLVSINTVRVLVRRVAGLGVVYRVLGTPLTPGAAVLDVTGPGQLVGGKLLFTFVGVATPGTTYDFTVQASTSLQSGPTSAPVRISIPQRPGPPRDLQVQSAVGTGKVPIIVADFLPPADNGGAPVEAYRVVGRASGKPSIVQSGRPTVLSNGRLQMRFTSYAPLRVYSFTAAALNPAGWGDATSPVRLLAPWKGVCQPEAEPCTAGNTCCSATYCQKSSRTQQLGTCKQCVAPNLFGCSRLNSCCQGRKCEMQNSTDSMGQCRTCISATRLGCNTAADCCNSLPCERSRSTASMGTCQRCISVARHGCSQNADCCNSSLCQKDAAASPLGSCRTCIAVSKHGCRQKSECCGGSSCVKDKASAAAGSCATCIPDNAYGCESNAECCTPGYQCIAGQCRCATEAEGCSEGRSCCGGGKSLFCQQSDGLDLGGSCEKCVGDGRFGCSRDSHCCTAGYLCNRGTCLCSQRGGKCLSDASCCGGPDGAAYCQRNSPTDAYGTCQACISSARFGCTGNNCCSGLMCLPGGGSRTCRCAAANSACISHDSCCPGTRPLFCERGALADAQGTCKNCIARGRAGCSATNNCCASNRCQRRDPAAQGTCQQCIALLSFGCDVAADCCNRNVCQRDAAEDTVGSCQTCVALTKSGCARSSNCCTGLCQREALSSAVGTCETCVELSKFGCARSSQCCDSNKCELQTNSSTMGQCKQCIADASFGCASSADCCGGSKCQKARATDPLGFCRPCVQDNTFGCAGSSSDDCCSDLMCRPSQNARTCTCAPQNAACVSDGSCCSSLLCVRDSPPPVPVPAGNFGICSSCIPDSKFGCLSKSSCCSASRQCQKATEDARAGTCETCIARDSFGCGAPGDCCNGGNKCQRRNATDVMGSCRSCIAQSLFGCQTSADCCGGATCQKERSTDQFGTCVPCVQDNKFGCAGSNSDGCCSDFVCQLSTNNARACICSPLDGTCLTKNSCCNINHICQRNSQSDALGSCKTCVAPASSGCATASDCCTKTNVCQKDSRLATTLGSCRTCVDDAKLGCSTDADCCNPSTPCNGGRCGCSKRGEACSSSTSCCQDGGVPLYCQKDGYLSPLGTCQPCVANAKYGCNLQASGSCCDSSGQFACARGLGDGHYVCRKTLQAPCGLEDSPCQTEADCCEGDPAVDQPPLYCVRATPLGRGTCKQCATAKLHGCDTADDLSCCGLGAAPEVCTDNGKGGGVCLVS